MDHILGSVEGVQEDEGVEDEAQVVVGPGKSGDRLPREGGRAVPELLDHGPAVEVGAGAERVDKVGVAGGLNGV